MMPLPPVAARGLTMPALLRYAAAAVEELGASDVISTVVFLGIVRLHVRRDALARAVRLWGGEVTTSEPGENGARMHTLTTTGALEVLTMETRAHDADPD